MFEEYLSVKLTEALSSICEDIDTEKLRFSILSGKANLPYLV